MLVRIGRVSEFGVGELRAFDVGDTPIAVANVDGHFYAFDDTCTHAACSLADGTLDDTTVTCACHGSQFDVTSGAVLRGPAEEPVSTHSVDVRDEDLLVEA